MPKDYPRRADFFLSSCSGDSRYKWMTRRQTASLILATTALGLAAASRYRKRYTFENKVVLITGGSRGLGLVLARELASRGASLGLPSGNLADKTFPCESVVTSSANGRIRSRTSC